MQVLRTSDSRVTSRARDGTVRIPNQRAINAILTSRAGIALRPWLTLRAGVACIALLTLRALRSGERGKLFLGEV